MTEDATFLKFDAKTVTATEMGTSNKLAGLIAMQILNEINGNAPEISFGGHENKGSGVENQAKQATTGTGVGH